LGTGPASGVGVDVVTSPPGAIILINKEVRGTSNLRLDLPPGSYSIEALLEGYKPETATFSVEEGRPATVSLTLLPLQASLRLVADLEAVEASLDGRPLSGLQEGEVVLDELAPGDYTLKVTGRHGEAVVPFRLTPGEPPALTGAVEAKELVAITVAKFGKTARITCNCAPAKVSIDGREAGLLETSGLDLAELSTGVHELVVGEGDSARKIAIEMGPAPGLSVFLKSDRNVGTLVVVAGEDDVTVFLNDRPMRRPTRRGQLRISNLAVQQYRVRVAKDGFEQEPEQTAQISKGQETTVRFELRPLPQAASLQIRGGVAGASVLLDGKPVGTLQADGSFSMSLAPGEHTIELRKESYKHRRIQKQFPAGATVQLAGAEVAMERGLGMLRLKVSPSGARVMIRGKSEPAARARLVAEESISLPEGSYVLTASAPKHADYSTSVEIEVDEVKNLEVRLKPLAEEVKVRQPHGMSEWDEPGAWTLEDAWHMRQGGNFVTYGITPLTGTVQFTALLRRGRRLQWFASYKDAKNYVLFQIDNRNFYRHQVVNGRQTELAKVPHIEITNDMYTLRMDVTATSITHMLRIGDKWVALDTWTDSSRAFPEGKFGFLLPGRDQIGLSNFAFYPK